MKECPNKFDHYSGDDDCIICAHEDVGGNWKRIICFFLRHKWEYTYSWIGHCYRCRRERYREGYI